MTKSRKRGRDVSENVDKDEEIYHQKRADFTFLQLVKTHASKPMWICPNNRIFLETSSPNYKTAYEFLIAIAQPICRLEHMHEYILTTESLYAAASVGLDTDTIMVVLRSFSKNELPCEIEQFVRESTSSYGKVKLVLRHRRYTIESHTLEALNKLLSHNEIRSAVTMTDGPRVEQAQQDTAESAFALASVGMRMNTKNNNNSNSNNTASSVGGVGGVVATTTTASTAIADTLDADDENTGISCNVFSFEIKSDWKSVQSVKEHAIRIGYPLLEEYDFRNDTYNKSLGIDLKPTTVIRPYQERSLSKMFSNGRARSGIIVLPCGAGKTLVGITAASTIKKSVLVLCTSAVSVEQWKQQFLLWTTVDKNSISCFTADSKEMFTTESGVCISTYTMIAYSGQRAADSERVMNQLQKREWGLLLLDEVHVVPANMFRTVVHSCLAHCKLGLTATLVREDDKIRDLNYLIGPKMYEANWLDLQKQGFIATVLCAEVWCPMTREFYGEYLKATPSKQLLLYTMNPNKYECCKFLVDFHEKRGDKVLVFSDNIMGLSWYAEEMKRPYIYGGTSQKERMLVLSRFQHDPKWNCVFISKVGDNSIDLPGANVIIQISSHFGARRQEAQRLGRILRAKPRDDNPYNAFFYTLVSRDTKEMYYSAKRQQFLVDQGYSFQVLTDLEGLKLQDSAATAPKEFRDMSASALEKCLKAEDAAGEVEADARDDDALPVDQPIRRQGSLAAKTGADGVRYAESRR